jgi:hypothetical protein
MQHSKLKEKNIRILAYIPWVLIIIALIVIKYYEGNIDTYLSVKELCFLVITPSVIWIIINDFQSGKEWHEVSFLPRIIFMLTAAAISLAVYFIFG